MIKVLKARVYRGGLLRPVNVLISLVSWICPCLSRLSTKPCLYNLLENKVEVEVCFKARERKKD